MKKMIFLGWMGLLMLGLATACSDSGSEEPQRPTAPAEVTITQGDSLGVAAAGGEAVVKFNAPKEWTANSDQKWCTLDQTKGSAGVITLTLTVAKNDVEKERVAVVTIVSGVSRAQAKVVQQPKGKVKPQVAITHTLKLFEVPAFTGKDVLATVLWGDKQQEAYKPGATHTYAAEGSHTVIIEVENSEEMTLKTLVGVTGIDFSKF